MGRIVGVWLVLSIACGADESAPTNPPSPDQEERGATPSPTPDETGTETENGTRTPEPNAQEQLARLIDPAGHSTVQASVEAGGQVFAVVQHNLMTAGFEQVAAMEDSEELAELFEGFVRGCTGGIVRCRAAFSPHLSFLLESIADHASAWSVVRVRDGAVVSRVELVALSLHDPDEQGLIAPSIRAEDVDGDGHIELFVEVPFEPLRDDRLARYPTHESGSVEYLLSHELGVQARITSTWSMDETMDVGDSPPRFENCTAGFEVQEDHSLQIIHECPDEDDNNQTIHTCRYQAADDRYACPDDAAPELLTHYPYGPHVVAQTTAELEGDLRVGRLFPSEAERAANNTREATGDAPAETEPETPTPCTHIVQDSEPPLNVRAGARSGSDTVGTLDNGTRLRVVETERRWARIAEPVEGWVWMGSLQPCP